MLTGDTGSLARSGCSGDVVNSNVVRIRHVPTGREEFADGLVALALGMRSAAEQIRQLDLPAEQQHRALVDLIAATRLISGIAQVLEYGSSLPPPGEP